MRAILHVQIVVLVLIAVLFHYFGLQLGYFFTVWWWDIPVHFLGGVWAALAGVWALHFFQLRAPLFVQCVAMALLAGVGWEVFEYALGIEGSLFMSHTADTIKDIVNDTLGGVAAGYLTRYILSS